MYKVPIQGGFSVELQLLRFAVFGQSQGAMHGLSSGSCLLFLPFLLPIVFIFLSAPYLFFCRSCKICIFVCREGCVVVRGACGCRKHCGDAVCKGKNSLVVQTSTIA